MNEMLKLMHDRRSTRAYRPEPLQEAVIQQILEAGRFAPVSYTHLTLPTNLFV